MQICFVCKFVSLCVQTRVFVCACVVFVCIRAHVCVYVCVCAHVFLCVHARLCVCQKRLWPYGGVCKLLNAN